MPNSSTMVLCYAATSCLWGFCQNWPASACNFPVGSCTDQTSRHAMLASSRVHSSSLLQPSPACKFTLVQAMLCAELGVSERQSVCLHVSSLVSGLSSLNAITVACSNGWLCFAAVLSVCIRFDSSHFQQPIKGAAESYDHLEVCEDALLVPQMLVGIVQFLRLM